ncbi:hypothetical protein AGMMS49546_31980 [Spirochaetia bacterium]|nr:hypothetical protein AGMMS49546_31980 [Spirochaetia bacterium]
MMVVGMIISFFSISLYLTIFGNYYYSFNRLFSFDYTFFSYLRWLVKLPLSTITRMMNVGIVLYLLVVPIFIYDFTHHNKTSIKRIILFLTLAFYNLAFYDPLNAYRIYISYNMHPASPLYANCAIILHQFNRVWILIYLFYPVFILVRYILKNTIKFIKRQIFLQAICLGIMNMLFYSVFFIGPFRMSSDKAITTGFWIFENIQTVFSRYYLIIPLTTITVLLFTLLLLLNYRMGSLIHVFTDRNIQRNIIKMNDILSDTLHSQKNLLFSINILANQAIKDSHNAIEEQRPIIKIAELSEKSLKKTSEMLDSFRNIRYKFKNYDIIEAVKDAIEKVNIPPNITVVWGSNVYDPSLAACFFDYYHICQTFINVFNNAVEAIEINGRENGIIRIDVAIQFQWIFIIIQDNGIGIEKKHKDKLFEPYYSTKSNSNNWGLGLSYAYKVIRAHLGFLRIESKYKESTSVQIMLPISRK